MLDFLKIDKISKFLKIYHFFQNFQKNWKNWKNWQNFEKIEKIDKILKKLIKIDKILIKKTGYIFELWKMKNMTCFFEFWWFWPKIDKNSPKNQILRSFWQIFDQKISFALISCQKSEKKWSFLGVIFLLKKWNFILAEYEVFSKNWKKQVIFLKKKCKKNAKKTGYIFELSKFEKLSLCKIFVFRPSWTH